MNNRPIMDRQDVARTIGRGLRAPATDIVMRTLHDDEIVLGVVNGTARWTGRIWWARVVRRFPTAHRYVQISRGRRTGEDRFAIIARVTVYT